MVATDNDPYDDKCVLTRHMHDLAVDHSCYEQHEAPATPNGLVVSSSVRTHTVSLCGTASHLKAALLDVVKLQAKRLYAAYNPPLMTNQTDPNAPDVTTGEKTNIVKKQQSN